MCRDITSDQLTDSEGLRVLSFTVCLSRNLLENQQDLNSDGEDEDEFVPSKKELQSSSEDDEDEAALESDEEVVLKKGRHAASGPRTPRSKQKTHSSTRTPRKTPNKKVKAPESSRSETICSLLLCLTSSPLTVSCLTDHTRHATDASPRHSQHPQQVAAGPTAC